MVSRKKVLFTSHTANFSKFNRPFMRWFKEQGYEVHYASMGEEVVLDCDKHFTVPFTRNPFKVRNITAYRQLKKIVDRENYEIIHTHTPMGSVITRLAAKTARRKGTRVIYTAHGFHFFTGASFVNWLIYYSVEKYMARYTDILITINQEDFRRARKKFRTDVRYVPGVGIDPKKFGSSMRKYEKQKLRTTLGLTEDDFVLIYPAELSKRKNQEWLITTLASLIRNDRKIHLLLPGQDSLDGKCQLLAEKLSVKDNIHFLGYRRDMSKLMHISDLAISSANQEGLPVNVMEAMGAGLPVIVTNCRGNRDVVVDGQNGYIIEIGDDRALRKKVKHLKNDSSLARTLGKNSKKQVQQYDLAHIVPQMAEIYKRKKVVLHLLNSKKFSGAENVACEIIKNTSEEYDVYYCSPQGPIQQALNKREINYKPIATLSYKSLRSLIKESKPTIIHAHDFTASIVASLFSRQTKVISHIHQNPQWLDGVNPKTILYRACAHHFSKIVVVTKAIKKRWIFQAKNQNIVVMYNTIDKDAIVEKGKVFKTRRYDLVFCGRLEQVKQPLDFIKIVAEISKTNPKVKAVMLGDGSLRDECEALINELNLRSHIEMVGFQPNPYPYFKNSRYLMITSLDEGFGLVALEATILGATVISYTIDSIREVVGGATLGNSMQDLVKIYNKQNKKTKSSKQKSPDIDKFLQTSQSKQENIQSLYKSVEGRRA